MKQITMPPTWIKDWNEIKKHVLLSKDFNDGTILGMPSDLVTLAAIMAVYRAYKM